MRERTRLKLSRNTARNMIGIVDEYGILEYGQGKTLENSTSFNFCLKFLFNIRNYMEIY